MADPDVVRHAAGLPAHLQTRIRGQDHVLPEMKKAHPLILDVVLQILWHGRSTVATGETFRPNHFLMGFTSNLGCVEAM